MSNNKRLHLGIGIIFIMIIVFATIILTTPTATADDAIEEIPFVETKLDKIIIALDSGHSTPNPGADGIIDEIVINEMTTEYLRILFEEDENYEVILTHDYDEDLNLDERKKVAIDNEADFLLSIHANLNAEDSTISGFEVYPQVPENPHWMASYEVASAIAEGFIEQGHTPRRSTGILYCRFEEERNGSFTRIVLTEKEESYKNFTGVTYGMLTSEVFPSVLIEQGYVMSETDIEHWLDEEGCMKSARVYYEAICAYFNTIPVE